MRVIIVLCSLTCAYALSLGYDYVRQSGFDGIPSAGFTHAQVFQAGSSRSNEHHAPATGTPEFEKEFFTFSAPEADFDANGASQQLYKQLKRSLRVIFIKGPDNSGLENAALQLAKSAVEQRTDIYVLNKDSDAGDFAEKFNALNKNNANKPEVHFVKYRTPADAENALHTIRDKYEGLGGKSISHDGGVAPVLNFISKAPLSSNNALIEPSNSYLPSNKRV